MGSEATADELMNEENPFKNPSLISISSSLSIFKVAYEGDVVEAKNITLLSQSLDLKDNQRPSIVPVTPDSNRENGEQNQDLSSPLTVALPLPQSHVPCSNSSDGNGLETPKEALFDSFAPGPDKFMRAPQRKKYGEESKNLVVRRLNFSCATNLAKEFSLETSETLSDEDRLFEIVHSTILDAIFMEQAKSDDSEFERPRTPKSARILSWVAETCPGAPMKSTRKSRDIDIKSCRKLEF